MTEGHTRIGRLLAAGALAALLVGAPDGARADETKDVKAAARATAAKSAKAVVTVKIVVKIKFGGREQEQDLEVLGTVIDPSGLTVASAAAVEPTSMMGGFGRGGRRGGGGDGGGRPGVESEITDTKILLDDGTEIEADVVLKDANLDLAFIKPREPQKLDAVALAPRGKPLEMLEEVFAVTRLGRGDMRSTAVALGHVRAVVKGPRTYYVCTPEVSASQGCIAFGADGAPLGIFVLKVSGEGGGRGGRDVSAILRPVEDVLEIAKQAKEAKAPERKPAEPEKAADAPSGEKAGGERPAEAPRGDAPKGDAGAGKAPEGKPGEAK
jgi:hypothetical protein